MHGCDWSSDVCSSDLPLAYAIMALAYGLAACLVYRHVHLPRPQPAAA